MIWSKRTYSFKPWLVTGFNIQITLSRNLQKCSNWMNKCFSSNKWQSMEMKLNNMHNKKKRDRSIQQQNLLKKIEYHRLSRRWFHLFNNPSPISVWIKQILRISLKVAETQSDRLLHRDCKLTWMKMKQ